MTTIQEEWNRFNLNIIPLDAPDVQRREMKRAFFAGAMVMITNKQ